MINSIKPGDWIFVTEGLNTHTIRVTSKLTDRIIGITDISTKFVLHKADYDRITGKMIDWWYRQVHWSP